MQVTLTPAPGASNLKCFYWSTSAKAWAIDGVETVGNVCKTSHLTTFAMFSVTPTATTNAPSSSVSLNCTPPTSDALNTLPSGSCGNVARCVSAFCLGIGGTYNVSCQYPSTTTAELISTYLLTYHECLVDAAKDIAGKGHSLPSDDPSCGPWAARLYQQYIAFTNSFNRPSTDLYMSCEASLCLKANQRYGFNLLDVPSVCKRAPVQCAAPAAYTPAAAPKCAMVWQCYKAACAEARGVFMPTSYCELPFRGHFGRESYDNVVPGMYDCMIEAADRMGALGIDPGDDAICSSWAANASSEFATFMMATDRTSTSLYTSCENNACYGSNTLFSMNVDDMRPFCTYLLPLRCPSKPQGSYLLSFPKGGSCGQVQSCVKSFCDGMGGTYAGNDCQLPGTTTADRFRVYSSQYFSCLATSASAIVAAGSSFVAQTSGCWDWAQTIAEQLHQVTSIFTTDRTATTLYKSCEYYVCDWGNNLYNLKIADAHSYCQFERHSTCFLAIDGEFFNNPEPCGGVLQCREATCKAWNATWNSTISNCDWMSGSASVESYVAVGVAAMTCQLNAAIDIVKRGAGPSDSAQCVDWAKRTYVEYQQLSLAVNKQSTLIYQLCTYYSCIYANQVYSLNIKDFSSICLFSNFSMPFDAFTSTAALPSTPPLTCSAAVAGDVLNVPPTNSCPAYRIAMKRFCENLGGTFVEGDYTCQYPQAYVNVDLFTTFAQEFITAVADLPYNSSALDACGNWSLTLNQQQGVMKNAADKLSSTFYKSCEWFVCSVGNNILNLAITDARTVCTNNKLYYPYNSSFSLLHAIPQGTCGNVLACVQTFCAAAGGNLTNPYLCNLQNSVVSMDTLRDLYPGYALCLVTSARNTTQYGTSTSDVGGCLTWAQQLSQQYIDYLASSDVTATAMYRSCWQHIEQMQFANSRYDMSTLCHFGQPLRCPSKPQGSYLLSFPKGGSCGQVQSCVKSFCDGMGGTYASNDCQLPASTTADRFRVFSSQYFSCLMAEAFRISSAGQSPSDATGCFTWANALNTQRRLRQGPLDQDGSLLYKSCEYHVCDWGNNVFNLNITSARGHCTMGIPSCSQYSLSSARLFDGPTTSACRTYQCWRDACALEAGRFDAATGKCDRWGGGTYNATSVPAGAKALVSCLVNAAVSNIETGMVYNSSTSTCLDWSRDIWAQYRQFQAAYNKEDTLLYRNCRAVTCQIANMVLFDNATDYKEMCNFGIWNYNDSLVPLPLTPTPSTAVPVTPAPTTTSAPTTTPVPTLLTCPAMPADVLRFYPSGSCGRLSDCFASFCAAIGGTYANNDCLTPTTMTVSTTLSAMSSHFTCMMYVAGNVTAKGQDPNDDVQCLPWAQETWSLYADFAASTTRSQTQLFQSCAGFTCERIREYFNQTLDTSSSCGFGNPPVTPLSPAPTTSAPASPVSAPPTTTSSPTTAAIVCPAAPTDVLTKYPYPCGGTNGCFQQFCLAIGGAYANQCQFPATVAATALDSAASTYFTCIAVSAEAIVANGPSNGDSVNCSTWASTTNSLYQAFKMSSTKSDTVLFKSCAAVSCQYANDKYHMNVDASVACGFGLLVVTTTTAPTSHAGSDAVVVDEYGALHVSAHFWSVVGEPH